MLEERCGIEPGSPERDDIYHHVAYKAKIHRLVPESGYRAQLRLLDDGPLAGEANYFEPYLPREIRAAAKAYRTARARLKRLSARPADTAARAEPRHRVAKPPAEGQWTVREPASDAAGEADGVRG